MRRTWLQMLAGGIAVAAFLGLAGCAENEVEPTYPKPLPIAPEEMPLEHESASLAAIPPAPPASSAPSEDIQIGVDETTYADADPSALTEFKSTLAPHGSWLEDDTYGTVWVPSASEVGPDFYPYVTAGHWAYEDDWVWVSDYPWGWAPFHYGRWVYIAGRGWAWIPGRTYRGAWVTWRLGYGADPYIGWAPMPPYWYWHTGIGVALYAPPAARYVYCPHSEVFAPGVGSRVVMGPAAAPIEANTRPYILADPTVSRIAAHPTVGPPPSAFGLAPSQIPRPKLEENNGLGRARALASPSTAVAAGAAPPRVFEAPRPRLSSTVTLGAQPNVFDAPPAPHSHGSPMITASPSLSSPSSSHPLPPFSSSPPAFSSPSVAPHTMASPRLSPGISSSSGFSGHSFERAPSLPSISHSAPVMTPHFSPAPRMTAAPSIHSAPTMHAPASSVHVGPALRSRSR